MTEAIETRLSHWTIRDSLRRPRARLVIELRYEPPSMPVPLINPENFDGRVGGETH